MTQELVFKKVKIMNKKKYRICQINMTPPEFTYFNNYKISIYFVNYFQRFDCFTSMVFG